jgi:hypothetical protein
MRSLAEQALEGFRAFKQVPNRQEGETHMSHLPAVIAVVAGLVVTSPALAGDCHTIDARAQGRITSQTATEATTVSRIFGGGIITGTTSADLIITGFDPATGIETFEGTITITAGGGTLTLHIFNGVFNTRTGEFSNDSVVVSGTGRFEDASGGLFFHGFVAADGSFTDDEISGTICLDE